MSAFRVSISRRSSLLGPAAPRGAIVLLLWSSAVACLAAAQTWYGVAPDGGKVGLINVFTMDANGRVIAEKGAFQTSDREFPKAGTFHCAWNSSSCYVATGVDGRNVEDAVYSIDRTTGTVNFKHTAPAGVFFDNLVYDWDHDDVYYVTFDTINRQSYIAKLNTNTGNLTYIFEITKDIGVGAIFAGQVSICSQLQELYVGVDSGTVDALDFVLRYDVSGATPVLKGLIPLLFPIPTSTFAICNATALEAMYANTIQVDGFDRETALLGDVIQAGKEGLFYPVVQGDLPSFNRRQGLAPQYFNGMVSEFGGEFILPAYEPFEVGPIFKHPAGFIWNIKFSTGPVVETLTPIDFFLAGASGVPGV